MSLLLAHPDVAALAEISRGTSFEGVLWLVGGCVRDELLGRPFANDFDLVLEGDAQALVATLFATGRTSPPVTYPRFGTAMLRLGNSDFEFVTARAESYEKGPRKPEVTAGTLLDDARRRDFTANSLMRNLHTGELRDLLGNGFNDLESRILRTPLDPVVTMRDDPLRLLRAVRFRGQLDFDYAENLRDALKNEASQLSQISAERIRDEFSKMLILPFATRCLREMMEFGFYSSFLPELTAMVGVEQGSFHHLDVWDHTLLVIENAASKDLVVNLACLLHDVGKPPTRTKDDQGRTRFFGHESVGGEMTRTILQRLKYSNEVIDAVVLLVRNHMRLSSMDRVSPSAARRLVRDLGNHLEDLLHVIEADAASLRPGVRALDLDPLREMLAKVRIETPVETLKSPLRGEEIMELLGIGPGPEVGRAMHYLTELVLEGEIAPDDREGAQRALLVQRKAISQDNG